MHIKNILKPGQILHHSDLNSKKQVLQRISDLFCQETPWINSKDVFNCLLERERIGSTAVGHGIAIPHCRVGEITEPMGCLLTLENSIDFNSVDDKPVNIIFALMVPEENHSEHLELLAQIAELLDKNEVREKIVNAQSSQELLEFINSMQG